MTEHANERPILMEAKKVTKRFGGLIALGDLDIVVRQNQIASVIGPNGAGKTTFFNCITGFYTPEEGEIWFDGRPIQGERPDQVTARGIARTYQNIHLFAGMTVLENVMVGSHANLLASPLGAMLRPPVNVLEEDAALEKAYLLLEFIGLGEEGDTLATNLPYGSQRRLEIARALASEPKLLLLDEPTAGVDPSARRDFWEELHRLAAQGISVLVSTHYMDEAERCHKLAYIAYGELLAQGTAGDVTAAQGLSTWAVHGDDLGPLAAALRNRPGVEQTALFGATLHASGRDGAALERTLREATAGTACRLERTDTGLEDVFIHLMSHAVDRTGDRP